MDGTKTVDEYIIKHENWLEELNLLRDICLSSGMKETIKWGGPTYTVDEKNVVSFGAFKKHIAIWFFQGALLKDEKKKLFNAQEGKTNAIRHWRFNSAKEIDIEILAEYIEEAIKNQKEGRKLEVIKNKPLIIPTELAAAIKNNIDIAQAFNKFSLAKKREFADYIAKAKRAETRLNRLDKVIPMIMEGIGLNDKYRK